MRPLGISTGGVKLLEFLVREDQVRHDRVQERAVGGRLVVCGVLGIESLDGDHGLFPACVTEGLTVAWSGQCSFLCSTSLVRAALELHQLAQAVSGL